MSKTQKATGSPWSKFDLPKDAPRQLDLIALKIWYKQVENELWLSHLHRNSDEIDQISPEKLEWSRWAIEKHYKRIQFMPIFPDRPVVIKPEYKMRLSNNAKTRIYVRVPLWVRIELVNSSSTSILELPTVILSNTWFGVVTSGELCYWISTSARLQIPEDYSRPYLGICPIQLINKSTEDVDIEKLCLRVEGLSLFDHNGQLWSDETQVIYRGKTEISDIDFSGKPPKEAKNAALISEPRKQARKGIKAKFFG